MTYVSDKRDRGPNKRNYVLCAIEGVDGAGKTTLVRAVAERLGRTNKVLCTLLAREMVDIFKEWCDVPSGRVGEYQVVLPSDFRHSAYIVEAAVQFRLQSRRYNQFDVVMFDRWTQTKLAYLEPPTIHRDLYQRLFSELPTPELCYHVRVPPEVAAQRLVARDDWMAQRMTRPELVAYLTDLQAAYDRSFQQTQHQVLDGTTPIDNLVDGICAEVRARIRGPRSGVEVGR